MECPEADPLIRATGTSVYPGMTTRSRVAHVYAGARIAYGLALVANPRRTARNWLGEGLDHGGGRVGARALGARDALLSAGAVQALRREQDPVPWLGFLAASDLVDIGATIADRENLPAHAAPATAVLAGAFCACGVALAAAYANA